MYLYHVVFDYINIYGRLIVRKIYWSFPLDIYLQHFIKLNLSRSKKRWNCMPL
jgi:hypothetical protein